MITDCNATFYSFFCHEVHEYSTEIIMNAFSLILYVKKFGRIVWSSKKINLKKVKIEIWNMKWKKWVKMKKNLKFDTKKFELLKSIIKGVGHL